MSESPASPQDISIDTAAASSGAAADRTDSEHAYRSRSIRRWIVIGGLAAALIVIFCADVAVGGAKMPLGNLIHSITSPWSVAPVDRQIVWEIRMPMSVCAILVGGALAAAGTEMQTILNNPLAEPYTLGISAAAGFGAALVAVTGASIIPFGAAIGMAGSAWIFALAACAVILLFARLRGSGAESMILLGIAIVFLFNALLALMQYLASQTQLEQVVFWTMGSLSRATWSQLSLLSVIMVIALPLFYRNSWKLTAFRMGDDRAGSLGVNVNRVRTLTLIGVSLLAATAVSIAGTIGFVGLVGPHVARMLVGEDQRFLLPASILSGGILLAGASVVSKLIVPGLIIPVGVITSLVGVPVFLVLIMARRQRSWS